MKKLAIIGTAINSLGLAPYNNDEYELWGLGGLYNAVNINEIGNFTRWFDIHTLEVIKAEIREYFEWYTTCPLPVYTQEVFSEIPTSVKYPLEIITSNFPRKYFNSTVDYMLALAIYEGYTYISLYGVDMAQDTEYKEQRPSCEYWCGYCDGAGINLYIPEQSSILKSLFLYGYEEPQTDKARQEYTERLKELDSRIAGVILQEDIALINAGHLNLVKEKSYLLGCRDDAAYFLQQKT